MELTRRLVDAGFSHQQSETVITVMRDAQAELASKQDIADAKMELKNELLLTKTDLKTEINSLSWQIKGLYAMNAASIAGLVWLANIVLEALKHLPK